jgi:hypothetical protein
MVGFILLIFIFYEISQVVLWTTAVSRLYRSLDEMNSKFDTLVLKLYLLLLSLTTLTIRTRLTGPQTLDLVMCIPSFSLETCNKEAT